MTWQSASRMMLSCRLLRHALLLSLPSSVWNIKVSNLRFPQVSLIENYEKYVQAFSQLVMRAWRFWEIFAMVGLTWRKWFCLLHKPTISVTHAVMELSSSISSHSRKEMPSCRSLLSMHKIPFSLSQAIFIILNNRCKVTYLERCCRLAAWISSTTSPPCSVLRNANSSMISVSEKWTPWRVKSHQFLYDIITNL